MPETFSKSPITEALIDIRRIDMPFDRPQATATITQTLGLNRETHIPYIFDVDVFRSTPDGVDAESLWEQLDELREVKNRVFFESLTDEAKELFR